MTSTLVGYVNQLSSIPSSGPLHDDEVEPGLGKHSRLLNIDASLWNKEIGGMLKDMLTMAGYPEQSIALHTAFFHSSVSPFLGFHPRGTVAPHTWKSFMTDDHTPVELSWCWSSSGDTPAVRYSVDPISRLAARGSDPVNTVANIQLLGEALSMAPNLDLYLHRHFRDALIFGGSVTPTAQVPQSQCFIAFDLLQRDIVVKQYYLPHRRALVEGTSNWDIIQGTMHKLAGPMRSILTPFRLFSAFMESLPVESRPMVEILAIDCLDPVKSRIKIYCRSRDTRFRSVMEHLSLGGRTPISPKEEDSFRELWLSVFGLETASYRDDQPLRSKEHRTGGILYYFEFKCNTDLPKSKVYLPVRHYAQNDDQIARGLSDYLERRGKMLSSGSYYESIKKLCKHRSLVDGLGLHTYVSWASEGTKWNVTAYINPEVYTRGA